MCRPQPTTKRIELQLGNSRKFFQMTFVSNQDFEVAELSKYSRLQQAPRFLLPAARSALAWRHRIVCPAAGAGSQPADVDEERD